MAYGRARKMLRAGGYCLLASYAVAAGIVALGGGFGLGDLGAFFAWTLPFGAAVGAVAALSAPRLSRARPLAALALAGLAAIAAAVLWTVAVALLLGPFFLLFSFPVFPCWLAGAATGLASAMGVGTDWRRTAVVAAFVAPLVVFVGTAALLALGPLRADRDVDVVAHLRSDASAGELNALTNRMSELEAVGGVSADYGENALYIEFSPDVSKGERDDVVRQLERSPVVARLEFDVPPDETD